MSAPTVTFYEFDVDGADPSGFRNAKTHASFAKELNATESGCLSYGKVNIDSPAESDTKCVIFRVSSMGSATYIDNMRFWLQTKPSLLSAASFNFAASGVWQSGASLTSSSGLIPTSLPASQNVFRGNAAGYEEQWTALSGVDDPNVSEYLYVNITCPQTISTGRYGIGGKDRIVYRMTFDYV